MKTAIKSLVNINTNPCNMCMPMGAATAFYGVKNCITIIHGSQGCSTYIRRHMATHYNEPVDIASSSLTEEGTVYGGEENLKKGLSNLIELYHPEVIGVATSCLAETIGEDIERIIENFYQENREYESITIIPVHCAGYSGGHAEGFMQAIYDIVSHVPMEVESNETINVITSLISPADTRYLKEMFASFGLSITLLPDLSENLDEGFEKEYHRLPCGGTSIHDIKKMAGAKLTIELTNIEREASPGKYLLETYGVPYRRLNLPVGLRDTDALYSYLEEISSRKRPLSVGKERSRYLDAMIDSHKYNSEGRAAIYGEPDFVVNAVRLCEENGIMPVVVATGSICKVLKSFVMPAVQTLAKTYFVKDYKIVDNADFALIEEMTKEYYANLMIGNSDGRRMEEKLQIPLVRRGFPIHDRIGGQRLKMLGYDGSLTLLDEITNSLLSKKETSFRSSLFTTYYKNPLQAEKNESGIEIQKGSIEEKTKQHPCFNCGANHNARIHLPVAPKCNIQCNYCVRKFDCPNESRPGVTTQILTPEESFLRFKQVKEKFPNLTVVGIAGPGDALANFEDVKQTLELIREYDPNITFCLSTNGLLLPMYAEELIRLGVTHVTVTINAVDPKIGSRIYKHIYYMGTKYEGESAAAILLSNQLSGLQILASKGIVCKVNIVTLKGINDLHIEEVVKKVKELGCYITNIMPLIPVQGSAFEGLDVVSNKELTKLRVKCGETMKQMFHCKQCRADAIGTLEEDQSIKFAGGCHSRQEETKPDIEKKETVTLRFAVATKGGMLVDQHFGAVNEFYIYEYKEGHSIFLERRGIDKYCEGSEYCGEKEDKIAKIIHTIMDCQGVIALRVGEVPKGKLKERGILAVTTYDRIEDAVKKAALDLLS